jgi:hypothetical protein
LIVQNMLYLYVSNINSHLQMATLNTMDFVSYYYWLYRQLLDQQQYSSLLSLQEQYTRAVRGYIQSTGEISISPADIVNSNAYYNYLNMILPYISLLHEQQPSLPYPSVLGHNVPAVTSGSSIRPYSAGYSSGNSSRLGFSSHLHLQAARPFQATSLPPRPGSLTLSEQREIHVAPTQVRIFPVYVSSKSCRCMVVWILVH